MKNTPSESTFNGDSLYDAGIARKHLKMGDNLPQMELFYFLPKTLQYYYRRYFPKYLDI